MAVTPSPEIPPAGKITATSQRPYSGTATPTDPTNQPGQYPPTADQHGIFGGPLPTGSGAPGTAGASGAVDPTNEPGQTAGDGFSGVGEDAVTESGAPGTQGAVDGIGEGPDAMVYTLPNDGIGPYQQVSINGHVSGPQGATQANNSGYATGGPQLPGIRGNEPEAGSGRYQPGGGRVLRGGRDVRP